MAKRYFLPKRSRAAAVVVAAAILILPVVTGGMVRMRQGASSAGAATYLSAPQRISVTVRPGDTLWSFAKRYGDPDAYILDRVDALADANGLSSSAPLLPGQQIVVPVSNPVELAKIQQHLALK